MVPPCRSSSTGYENKTDWPSPPPRILPPQWTLPGSVSGSGGSAAHRLSENESPHACLSSLNNSHQGRQPRRLSRNSPDQPPQRKSQQRQLASVPSSPPLNESQISPLHQYQQILKEEKEQKQELVIRDILSQIVDTNIDPQLVAQRSQETSAHRHARNESLWDNITDDLMNDSDYLLDTLGETTTQDKGEDGANNAEYWNSELTSEESERGKQINTCCHRKGRDKPMQMRANGNASNNSVGCFSRGETNKRNSGGRCALSEEETKRNSKSQPSKKNALRQINGRGQSTNSSEEIRGNSSFGSHGNMSSTNFRNSNGSSSGSNAYQRGEINQRRCDIDRSFQTDLPTMSLQKRRATSSSEQSNVDIEELLAMASRMNSSGLLEDPSIIEGACDSQYGGDVRRKCHLRGSGRVAKAPQQREHTGSSTGSRTGSRSDRNTKKEGALTASQQRKMHHENQKQMRMQERNKQQKIESSNPSLVNKAEYNSHHRQEQNLSFLGRRKQGGTSDGRQHYRNITNTTNTIARKTLNKDNFYRSSNSRQSRRSRSSTSQSIKSGSSNKSSKSNRSINSGKSGKSNRSINSGLTSVMGGISKSWSFDDMSSYHSSNLSYEGNEDSCSDSCSTSSSSVIMVSVAEAVQCLNQEKKRRGLWQRR